MPIAAEMAENFIVEFIDLPVLPETFGIILWNSRDQSFSQFHCQCLQATSYGASAATVHAQNDDKSFFFAKTAVCIQ